MSWETSTILPSFTATSRGPCNCCPGSITVPSLTSKSKSSLAGWLGEASDLLEHHTLSTTDAVHPPKINLENSRRVVINCSTPLKISFAGNLDMPHMSVFQCVRP